MRERWSLVSQAALAALPIILAVPPAVGGAAHEGFSERFEDRTVRMDLARSGNADAQTWALERVGLEGRWAGSRLPFDLPNLGQLRLTLVDEESGETIFSRGFSSLYTEWLSTGAARRGEAFSMTETLRFPLPRRRVLVRVEERDADGQFRPGAELRFDPAAYALGRFPAPTRAVERISLVAHGDIADHVDLVIVGDGYPDDQAEKFRRDARRVVDALAGESPFRESFEAFNVTAVRARGEVARGPAEPRKGRDEPSAMTAFDTFGSPRYLCPRDLRRLQDLAGLVPHDALVVLVNTARYGGGGVFRQFTVFTADGEFDEYLFLHEFGHGFAGLGDEYYTSAVAYEDLDAGGVEPWEPNLTANPALEDLKWAELVADGVPLPTPDEPAFDGVVGAFEGGGYVAEGIFRPTRSCKMKDKGAIPYCPVCRAAIERVIEHTVGRTAAEDAER